MERLPALMVSRQKFLKSAARAFYHIWLTCLKQYGAKQLFRKTLKTIVHIYKRNGDRSCCDNHRGISLLSTAGKILARVLLNRLNDHVSISNIIPESQCGFRAGRGTTDMIFAARQIQEKCREQNHDLYTVFIDLTKAFESVNRQGLWQVLRKIGCPEKFVKIIQSF